jgi:hypothetical protein
MGEVAGEVAGESGFVMVRQGDPATAVRSSRRDVLKPARRSPRVRAMLLSAPQPDSGLPSRLSRTVSRRRPAVAEAGR